MAKKTEAEIERLKRNNARLRELVVGTGLSQPEALKAFNKGLGPIGSYSPDAWKSFLAGPDAKKFRLLGDELLVHAEKVFSKLIKPV